MIRPGGGTSWSDKPVAAGRGHVGTGLFRRVSYVDLLDGADGRAVVRSLASNVAGIGLSQVISTGHEVALEEDRFTTLLLPLSGQVHTATPGQDLVAVPGEGMILPPGRRRTVTRRDGNTPFHAVVVNLPDLPVHPDRARTVRLSEAPDLALAADLLTCLCTGAGHGSAGLLASVRHLLHAALPDLAAEGEGRIPHRRGVSPALARAERLLHERFSEDLNIVTVAAEAGISARQLQDLFRRRHGLSPHAYVTRLRLEHAHVLLKGATPVPTVTEAALAAGFSHLGRFPGTYRDRFSALPSETRARLR